MGTLNKELSAFMVLFRWIIFRVRNASNKSCNENQNTHFIHNDFFPNILPYVR